MDHAHHNESRGVSPESCSGQLAQPAECWQDRQANARDFAERESQRVTGHHGVIGGGVRVTFRRTPARRADNVRASDLPS